MDDFWVIKNFKLHFRIGVRTIFDINVSSLILNTELTHKTSLPDKIILPPNKFTDNIDLVYLTSVPLEKQSITLDTPTPITTYFAAQYVRCFIEIAGDHSQYLQKLPTSTRQNTKRRVRKFAEHCGNEIKWKTYRGSEMSEFYPLAKEVSKKTYQQIHLGEGIPDDKEFYEEMMNLASNDRVRGYLLFHDLLPIAYSYCYVDEDVLSRHRCGYDPDYRQWSPGSILYYLLIEQLFKNNEFRILDMGQGDFEYKKSLATGNVTCTDIMFFRNTIKNRAIINSHSTWQSALKFGIQTADLLKVKTFLKSLNRKT